MTPRVALKAEEREPSPGEQPARALSIPNREVRLVYSGTFRKWMAARMEGHGAVGPEPRSKRRRT